MNRSILLPTLAAVLFHLPACTAQEERRTTGRITIELPVVETPRREVPTA